MKKIVIFTSYGGGGQKSITQALDQYLSDSYEIITENIFSSTLGSIDPIKKVTWGKYTGEDVYNYCLSKQFFRLLSTVLYCFGAHYYNIRHKKSESLITNFLQKESPDLIISIIPFVNQMILDAAQKQAIPFILFPPDLDTDMYLNNMSPVTYDQFYLALPFTYEFLLEKIAHDKIPQSQILVTGYPLKKEFFQEHDSEKIKERFNIPKNKKIIFVLLGSHGAPTEYRFAKALSTIDYPAHIIFCVGKNHGMKQKVDALIYQAPVTKTVFDYTNHVAEILAITDILLTKSGTVSVCEGLYMSAPMILDGTSCVLKWERENHRFIVQHNLGVSAKTCHDLVHIITQWLNDPEEIDMIKKRISEMEKKNGGEEIRKLIDQLLKTI